MHTFRARPDAPRAQKSIVPPCDEPLSEQGESYKIAKPAQGVKRGDFFKSQLAAISSLIMEG